MGRTLSNDTPQGYRRARASTLPRLWLTTDAARTGAVAEYAARLPAGGGIVLRHYGVHERADLARGLADLGRRRRFALVVAEDWRLAAAVKAHGLHLPERIARRGPSPGARLWLRRCKAILTVSAHNPAALGRARALKAEAAFLSPVFATASHPERRPLGLPRAALMVRSLRVPVIALGGVRGVAIAAVQAHGFYGSAGIGLFTA